MRASSRKCCRAVRCCAIIAALRIHDERHMTKLWKSLIALLAACAGTADAAANFTDLWYDPAQSGWGVNVVHQGDTAFATLFVYGPDRQPTWYSASNLRVTSLTGSGLPNFEGGLYRTTGPWYGGPFDPATVTFVRVGTLYIEGLAQDRLRVSYEVEGRTIASEVVRATLAAPQPAFYYHATLALRESLPGGPIYGTARYNADLTFDLDGGNATLRVTDQYGRECTYAGAYSQTGRFSSVSGNFACAAFASYPARSGTFAIDDMEFTVQGITGVLRTEASDRVENGRFAAARF
jgi:hypothetical protein